MISDVVKQNELELMNSYISIFLDVVKKSKPCSIKTRKKYVFWGEEEHYIDFYASGVYYKNFEVLEKSILPKLTEIYPDIRRIKFKYISDAGWSSGTEMRVYL